MSVSLFAKVPKIRLLNWHKLRAQFLPSAICSTLGLLGCDYTLLPPLASFQDPPRINGGTGLMLSESTASRDSLALVCAFSFVLTFYTLAS